MDKINLTPVGVVHNSVEDKLDLDWGAVRSKIVLEAEYRGGLMGLEAFSHVIIVTYLNKAHYDAHEQLQRRPRGLAELPLVGIFAQRSKDRPNTIGLTAVKLLGVGEDWLEVEGLDAINGTPVLDIKPYYPAYDRRDEAVTPPWVDFILKGYF